MQSHLVFFIKNSKSSAISLSVTPSLILPKIYSNAISPIFSASAIFFNFAFVFYFSRFVYKILHFNKILSVFLVLLLFAYFLRRSYMILQNLYIFSSILENIFSKPFAISITSKPFCFAHAPVLCIANL